MIPEAAVEAAAIALAESIGKAAGIWEMHSWGTRDAYRKHARAALEAAAPHTLDAARIKEIRDEAFWRGVDAGKNGSSYAEEWRRPEHLRMPHHDRPTQ